MKTLTVQQSSLKRKLANVAVLSMLAASTALATGIVPSIQTALAQSENTGSRSITISPPSLPLNLKPGQKTEGKKSLVNDTSGDISFDVYFYDMIVTNNVGTPEILPGGTIINNKYSASSWIGIEIQSLLLRQIAELIFRYYAQVPEDAGPGGHYAAIVYKPRQMNQATHTGAAVSQQVATLVYFDVAGVVKESAQVKNFDSAGFSEYGPVDLIAEVTNNGDSHIKPSGKFSVKDMFGKVIASKDIPEGNIFPGGVSRIYETAVGKHWMIGRYTATFTASYGRANNLPLMATIAFWVFPWKVAVAILILVAAGILGYIYMKKNKHQSPPTPQS
jgi:hypothetical protein